MFRRKEFVWWKVYKLIGTPGGTNKRVFKTEIMDLSQIKDAELHVRDLAIDKGRGSGDYVITKHFLMHHVINPWSSLSQG